MGVAQQPSNITLNGMSITSGVVYNASSKVAVISGLQNLTQAGAWSADWVLKW